MRQPRGYRDRDPVPPTDVRLHLADGRVVPVDCRFAGYDADGMAEWVVIGDYRAANVVKLTAAVFPPRTTLGVHFWLEMTGVWIALAVWWFTINMIGWDP